MFTNIGAYPKTTLFGSKKHYGLQNDLAYKLKESVNNYHNVKIKNKTQKEAPYEHVSSSFDDDEDNSNYYENFIHKLVGSNNASTQIEHAKRKTNTCNIKSNKYEMYNNNNQLVNTFQDKKKYLNYNKGDSSGGSGNSGNKKRYLKTKKAITSNNVSFHNSNSNNNNNNNKKEKSNFTDGLMTFNQKFKEVKSINIKRKGADILKKVLSEVSQEQNNNKNNINNQQSSNNHLAVPSILKHTHTESSSRLKKQRETETPQTLVLNRRKKHNKNNKHIRKVSIENEPNINTKSNKSQCSNNTNRNCIGCTQLLPTQNFLEIKKEESFCIRKRKGSGSPKKNISNTSVAICNNNNNNDKQVNNCRRSDIKRTTEIPRRKNECNSIIKCKYNQNEIKLRRNASDEGIRKRINHLKRISGNGIHYSNISQSNNNNKRTQRENDNNNNNEHNNNNSNKTKKPKPKIIQSKTPDIIRAHNNNNKEKKKSKYFCCFNI